MALINEEFMAEVGLGEMPAAEKQASWSKLRRSWKFA